MAENLRAARCQVQIEVWPRMPHGWHLFAPVLPEARTAIAGIGAFADQVFAGSPGRDQDSEKMRQ
jgi:acetyl esterase/lipase